MQSENRPAENEMMKTLLTAAAFVVALTGMASAEANSKFSPGAYEA